MEWGVEGSGEPNGRGYATVLNLPSAKEFKISWSITITVEPHLTDTPQQQTPMI